MKRVLLIDDDTELCDLMVEYLGRESFEVDSRHRGDAGLDAARSGGYDICILDIMLPGLSGTEVLRQLRESSSLPVLMLTARGDDVDRIIGLELGADDYLPKPFNPRELLARLRAILRRSPLSESATGPVAAGDLCLHPGSREATRDGAPLSLTSTEFSILEVLMRRQGEVVDKDTLSRQGLGRPLGRFDRSIDMHLSNLRRKLGPGPDGGHRIETVRGVGYLLKSS